jgi:hypothetical protein
MSRINDENYYQISGWMLNRLQLKGTELQVFAIIYGFSQDGESMFGGSLNYLCDWVGASRPTVIKALKDLVSKEYIVKETTEINHVTFNRYKANLSTIADLRGSKETLQGSKETLHNIDSNNNTHTLSLDNVFDTGHTPSPSPKTSPSGKLFSSEKQVTRKSSVQKTNNFISACQREAIKKQFDTSVLSVLADYFRMLAEFNCLLPSISIAEQLVWLQKVPQDRQVAVVKNTISRGWKSLQYESEAVLASSSQSRDTADPNAFQAKTEEEKSRDWRKDVPSDHIF